MAAGTLSAECLSSANQMPQTKTNQLRSITMKTLIIKDLARTEQLDRTAMAGVRGGWTMNSPYYSVGDVTYAPSYDDSIHATQNMFQSQEVMNATANGSAFVDGVYVNSNVSQDGNNTIVKL
jgi:hypothetical protein